MKNKTVVNIYDMEFTFVGEESEEYVQKIASLVDQRMREVTENSKYSTLAAAILTAANIADDYFKALAGTEELRGQLRGYFEEISRLKDENDRLRRASRSAGSSPRRRRSILEELDAEKAAPEVVVETVEAVEAAEAALEAVAPAEPAPVEETPAEPAEPASEAAPETETVAEPAPETPEVTLVMDSDIAAAEDAVPVPAPEELEEGEQMEFEQ